jgi:uncharacterized protein YlxW (UPF0749 family)
MNELIEKISNAISNNDITGLAEDFVVLSAEIRNIQEENDNLKGVNAELSKTVDDCNSNVSTYQQTIANLIKKINVDTLTSSNDSSNSAPSAEIDFDKILNE